MGLDPFRTQVPVKVSISVVSHLQGLMVQSLLNDLENVCNRSSFEVILTLNLPEALPFKTADFSFPLLVVFNEQAKGFSENHNQAFSYANGEYFCVLNPDIRLPEDPFPELLNVLANPGVGLAVPFVFNQQGGIEDSIRKFPTPVKIMLKLLGQRKTADYRTLSSAHQAKVSPLRNQVAVEPDWAAGMFMLFTRPVFLELGGFDQRYFLYYEDVDICARLRLSGHRILALENVRVVHDAQRSSHRQLKYLMWHISSMMRFFRSSVFRQLHQQKLI